MKNYTLLHTLSSALVCLLLTATAAQAQAPGSGGPTPAAVPLDGGASLLLASGVALGIKKLRDRHKAR